MHQKETTLINTGYKTVMYTSYCLIYRKVTTTVSQISCPKILSSRNISRLRKPDFQIFCDRRVKQFIYHLSFIHTTLHS